MSLITITQDFASGGFTIAQIVAKSLDLIVYDDDHLKEKAVTDGIRPVICKVLRRKHLAFSIDFYTKHLKFI